MLSPSPNPRQIAVALCVVVASITVHGAPVLSQPNQMSPVQLHSLPPYEVQDLKSDTRQGLIVREPERHVTL